MRESQIEDHVCDYAVKHGMWQSKFTAPGRRGAPDRIFTFRRRDKSIRVFWIEFKATGVEPTKQQKLEHKRMRKHGLTVYVCDDKAMGRSIIDAELNEDADDL